MSARSRPLAAGEAKRFAWSRSGAPARVIAALEAAAPGAARFVGGCVRDSLIGETPKDIDVATTLTPDRVIKALRAAGLRSAPTGIEHGTVTAIAEGTGVEVTTLRADVSTDGRRATVAFTEDWSIDAGRRDFTINAFYLDAAGVLYDPVNGEPDLAARRVRYIGAAVARIREDYLRILRFFRFSARFADAFDEEGLAAASAEKAGIARLSAERVGDELSRILSHPRAAFAVAGMAKTGVLAAIRTTRADVDLFAAMKALDEAAPAPAGLAALWGARDAGIDGALRLSNADSARRRNALAAADMLAGVDGGAAARRARYLCGPEAYRDGALLSAAKSGGEKRLAALLSAAEPAPPAFPFSGKDVLARGVPAGPAVAAILKAAEDAYIAEDFPSLSRARELFEDALKRSVSGSA